MGFFRKTVDGIVADITNKIEQLHAVKELHLLEAEAHAKAVQEFTELKAFAEKEADRAEAIAAKLTSLVTV